ncbi:MAG TPA: right-handed parallel beta-helix repeat-containing protein [Thermoanaerobaculia bacterium]|nr:right-handed parallel beta-helix repeat-containing protein [Thermoanaerobaculia bacterium]
MLASLLLSIALVDVWVDPVNGHDGRDGATRETAVRTLAEAWQRIPQATPLTTGVRIQLMAGEHPRASIPHYFESRWGTADAPIVIQSADGSRTAHIRGDFNVYDVRYLSLIGLDMRPEPAGDVVHCERCDHFTIRDSHLDGGARQAHETLKVNQSQYVYIEGSDIHGAYDNAIDLVAVQYGHAIGNRIWDAEDWCMYAKGGSAYFRVARNEIFQCGTGGFTAGQGTGFQYMVSPWLHYEAYGVTATHNYIHDTEGAGLGVNGGYNILFAFNRLERVGSRSHMVEVVYGGRSCDGEADDPSRVRCQENLDAGGWGNTLISDGNNHTRIPNRNVFIYNNVMTNPAGFASPSAFSIAEPSEGLRAHVNLQIRGNTIVNAGDLGTPESVLRENTVNGVGPNETYAIPPFTWTDAPLQPRVPAPPNGKQRSARH